MGGCSWNLISLLPLLVEDDTGQSGDRTHWLRQLRSPQLGYPQNLDVARRGSSSGSLELVDAPPHGPQADDGLVMLLAGPIIEPARAPHTLGFLAHEVKSLADVVRAPMSEEHDSAMHERLSSSWPAGRERWRADRPVAGPRARKARGLRSFLNRRRGTVSADTHLP